MSARRCALLAVVMAASLGCSGPGACEQARADALDKHRELAAADEELQARREKVERRTAVIRAEVYAEHGHTGGWTLQVAEIIEDLNQRLATDPEHVERTRELRRQQERYDSLRGQVTHARSAVATVCQQP